MKNLWIIVLLFLAATDVASSDQSAEMVKEVTNNISSEFAQCAAYFTISSEALKRAGENPTADKYRKTSDTALEYALIAAQEGRTAAMAQKVTLARFEAGMKEMLEEIDKDVSNIAILQNKYGLRCKNSMERPEDMMKEWQDKVLQKYLKPSTPSNKRENQKH